MKRERRRTKNKTTKWMAGRLGPQDKTNKVFQRSSKSIERNGKVKAKERKNY